MKRKILFWILYIAVPMLYAGSIYFASIDTIEKMMERISSYGPDWSLRLFLLSAGCFVLLMIISSNPYRVETWKQKIKKLIPVFAIYGIFYFTDIFDRIPSRVWPIVLILLYICVGFSSYKELKKRQMIEADMLEG